MNNSLWILKTNEHCFDFRLFKTRYFACQLHFCPSFVTMKLGFLIILVALPFVTRSNNVKEFSVHFGRSNNVFTILSDAQFLAVIELFWPEVSTNLSMAQIFGQNAVNRIFGLSQFHFHDTQRCIWENFDKIAQFFSAFWHNHELDLADKEMPWMSSRPFLKRVYHSWTLLRDNWSLPKTNNIKWNVLLNVSPRLKKQNVGNLFNAHFVPTTRTNCHYRRSSSILSTPNVIKFLFAVWKWSIFRTSIATSRWFHQECPYW